MLAGKVVGSHFIYFKNLDADTSGNDGLIVDQYGGDIYIGDSTFKNIGDDAIVRGNNADLPIILSNITYTSIGGDELLPYYYSLYSGDSAPVAIIVDDANQNASYTYQGSMERSPSECEAGLRQNCGPQF